MSGTPIEPLVDATKSAASRPPPPRASASSASRLWPSAAAKTANHKHEPIPTQRRSCKRPPLCVGRREDLTTKITKNTKRGRRKTEPRPSFRRPGSCLPERWNPLTKRRSSASSVKNASTSTARRSTANPNTCARPRWYAATTWTSSAGPTACSAHRPTSPNCAGPRVRPAITWRETRGPQRPLARQHVRLAQHRSVVCGENTSRLDSIGSLCLMLRAGGGVPEGELDGDGGGVTEGFGGEG